MNDHTLESLPVFPLRQTPLFPFVLAPFSAGRPASVKALEVALARKEKSIAVFAQRDARVQDPGGDDLFEYGTRATVRQMARSEDTIEVVLQGIERIRLVDVEENEDFLKVRTEPAPIAIEQGTEVDALQRELVSLAASYQSTTQIMQEYDVRQLAVQIGDPMHLVYLLASLLELDKAKAQRLLTAASNIEAMQLLLGYLRHELQVAELRQEIAGQAATEVGREQREYMLRQQLRAIQEELGETDPQAAEARQLRSQFEEVELPAPVRKEAERELARMERIPPSSPEYQVARSYLELILDLPWQKSTDDMLDLGRAREILDEDHFDLEDIKERILEHLAVLKLNPEAQAPILCFVGPPGVGKTSLGQSIARALGRQFERFSIGGLHDEAELRGHRRTYIGAMPGRIMQAIRRAGVTNPLLMLDEVDKVGRDFRGDPASALLEILDPAQNFEFRDNYLDLPFDLSKVFFITTANTLDTIPGPLLDRMEVIRLSGYSDQEKLEIARRYLVDRMRRQAGLTEEQFRLSDETIVALISRYTREAGVRNLTRVLGRVARKVALHIAEGKEPAAIDPDTLTEWLGPPRFFIEQARQQLPAGVATGLAWTESGGDVLYIEAIQLPENEGLTLTGQLGGVMQESARAARNYILSHGEDFGVGTPKAGVHIHVPAGAIPKDGPSAGVTMAAAVASLYSGYATRSDTAMTGEITLTGLVLPVGGVKEKVLAARRAGLKRVILPARNEDDLAKLPDSVRNEMEFIFAERIEDVLAAAIPELSERLRAA
ncbi:endopeptidase La [Thiohalomonas denitrificans]|uniref:Lon protease n=1 Tax=Thiohalomonas denitrificans TaxID=415747 RepID=A0A1G5PT30_9GAMM|nr:endopeptidase La [Thiohalomonas denitrificans]SCZ52775.1 ATP-dependent Lon protease [Thiohalomonas denitrificans]